MRPVPGPSTDGESAQPAAIEPTASLVEALDRLRATEALLPVEIELARHLRGTKYYKEETRHGLPVISDPDQSDPAHAPPPPREDA